MNDADWQTPETTPLVELTADSDVPSSTELKKTETEADYLVCGICSRNKVIRKAEEYIDIHTST